MSFVEGYTLGALLDAYPGSAESIKWAKYDAKDRLEIVKQILGALKDMHDPEDPEVGSWVFNDLKPDNIMVSGDHGGGSGTRPRRARPPAPVPAAAAAPPPPGTMLHSRMPAAKPPNATKHHCEMQEGLPV